MYEPFTDEDYGPFVPPPSVLPPGLAEMEPGPELGRLLAEVDSIPVSGYERAVLVAAHRRMVSYHQAEGYRQIGLLYEDCVELAIQPEEGMWAATTELSTLLHLSGRAAELTAPRSGSGPSGSAISPPPRKPSFAMAKRSAIVMSRSPVTSSGPPPWREGTSPPTGPRPPTSG